MHPHNALSGYGCSRQRNSLQAPLWLVPSMIAAVAVLHLAGSLYGLVQHFYASQHVPLRASCCFLLAVLGILQLLLACKAWRMRKRATTEIPFRARLFSRWLLVGFVICYGSSILLGSLPSTPYVFLTLLSCWYTAVHATLSRSTDKIRQTTEWLKRPSVQTVGWGVYFLAVSPLVFELSLRIYAITVNDTIPQHYSLAQKKLAPGVSFAGRTVNSEGYWDQEFEENAAQGLFRVAAVGGNVTLCGTAESNFLTQLEQQNSQLEIYNFGLPGTGPDQYGAQVRQDILRYHPDLLLVVLSVGTDIAQESVQPSLFDCRSLHLIQLGTLYTMENTAGEQTAQNPPAERTTLGNCTKDQLLRSYAHQLRICKTPIDKKTRQRWQALFAALDQLTGACQQAGIPVSLVVIPTEFQVNPVLLRTLQRRAGYAEQEIDLELPQRKLADYARRHNIPLLDLLPSMRRSEQRIFQRNSQDFNRYGNQFAAQQIGRWIQTRLTRPLQIAGSTNRLSQK